jgi:hypothetical protein
MDMMENLIDLGIEVEDDLVAQHIKSLEQADFQRNQLIKVSSPPRSSCGWSSRLIHRGRNYVMKFATSNPPWLRRPSSITMRSTVAEIWSPKPKMPPRHSS